MHVLVTGATGFVGRLGPALLTARHRVRALVRGYTGNSPPDIGNADSVGVDRAARRDTGEGDDPPSARRRARRVTVHGETRRGGTAHTATATGGVGR